MPPPNTGCLVMPRVLWITAFLRVDMSENLWPLRDSRQGSCSEDTTYSLDLHTFFMKSKLLGMVHADSSNFTEGVSKTAAYDQIIEAAKALFDGQRNWVCNAANTASLIWHALHALPSPSNKVNWAGFYVLDPSVPDQLILAPFQGKVACQTITFGKGVCGAAAASQKTLLVPDVEKFPGHIACDGDSRSEIVVPILKDGKVVAIIDIDCAVESGFDEEDQRKLEELAEILSEGCDW
ncbi:hypothetical protein AC579_3549 [Pseudocercospora musae]|uniref:GAF domain-containing protein n=1 Tax=Pseudocercospora musae TaxID=113226 RepID=A0A139IVY9_9PEZI|nr:hypothetical protein AC579_3549 [Pseudocercospora musae]